MSEVIKINKRPTNIIAYAEGATVFQTSEEQKKQDFEVELHNHYTKGFNDGQQAIRVTLEQGFNEKILKKYSELNNVISALNDKAVQLDSQFEILVMNVAFIISETILKREIEKESIVKTVIDEALRKVIGANEIIVRLNPKDYESIILEGKSFQLKDSFSQIKFEKDDRIELGGCFIESEIGNADGRISSQINELKRKIESGFNNS
jgi:flagellar assembly protein FliH